MRLERVLIVSAKEQSTALFVQLLETEQCSVIDCSKSGADGRRHLSEHDYDLVIIHSPLPDESGDGLAADICSASDAGVILVVKSDLEEETEKRVLPYGVFVLGSSVSRQMFVKTVRFTQAMRNRLGGVKKENVRLQKKIDDTRIINRAKGILMEYLSMTEPQAHKYLEKQAMDLRITKIEVAKRLLSTYEN